MCYLIFFSTNSLKDLSEVNSNVVQFAKATKDDEEIFGGILQHANRWQLVSRYGSCSCHYRHLEDSSLGFFEHLDWWPEEEDEVESTRAAYDVFAAMVSEGWQVDVMDAWQERPLKPPIPLEVSLGVVKREDFLFMLDRRFILLP